LIWNDKHIWYWAKDNVFPFDKELINPASIDLRLGHRIKTAKWYWRPVLWRIAYKLGLPQWSEQRYFETYLLKPGEFVLCSSLELTRIPDDSIGILYSKSSTGRRGIEHLHAGYGDPGFGNNKIGGADWTWELTNAAPWPNLLTAGEPLMQLVLARLVDRPSRTYKETGRYNNQIGPTEAKI